MRDECTTDTPERDRICKWPVGAARENSCAYPTCSCAAVLLVKSPPLASHYDYEKQGTGYDSGAVGYELQGRRRAPATPRLIAFTGLAGSGKSTAAQHLVDRHGFVRMRFAGPLKSMMHALGLTAEHTDGSLKEVPCELLGGKTPRYAMQTIGTEWGRNMIDPNLWIKAFRAALDRVPAGTPVVVDDCRFPNEAEAVNAAGCVIIRIVRPGAGAGAAGHSSEGQELPWDDTLYNDDSIPVLLHRLRGLLAAPDSQCLHDKVDAL